MKALKIFQFSGQFNFFQGGLIKVEKQNIETQPKLFQSKSIPSTKENSKSVDEEQLKLNKQDQRPALAHNPASDKMIGLGDLGLGDPSLEDPGLGDPRQGLSPGVKSWHQVLASSLGFKS